MKNVLSEYKVRIYPRRIEAIRSKIERYMKHRDKIEKILQQHGYKLIQDRIINPHGWVAGFETEWADVIRLLTSKKKPTQLKLF